MPSTPQMRLDRSVTQSLRRIHIRQLLSNLPVRHAIQMLDAVQMHLTRAIAVSEPTADDVGMFVGMPLL